MQQSKHGSAGAARGCCRLRLVDFEGHENHVSHETQGLSDGRLVVRRGKPFKLTLLFHGRTWSLYSQRLELQVYLGNLSQRFPVQFSGDQLNPHSWRATTPPGNQHPEGVTVHVCSPALSPVGQYRLSLHVETPRLRRTYRLGTFVLLCNPWLPDDPVYMPLDVHLQEYVRNDYGMLFTGSHTNVAKRPWSFGQYEPGVLEACLKLLDVSPEHLSDADKDYTSRGDPVYLSRVACAMVNCNDDRGVLEGRWEGGYQAGVKPTDWSGSADILRRWASSGCSPVRYGQCWVFASVLCTVMRVLGIPSRVVTVFNAAHDTDGNTAVEEFYTSTGKKLNLSKDSIWNFHVWVECWMRRLDLSPEFDGWQVVDPTPQETSAGRFRSGPCPVAAIQQRCLLASFDTAFLYASVDADVVRVIVRHGREVGRTVDTDSVGRLICTKSVSSDRPENLTQFYKGGKRLQQANPVGTMSRATMKMKTGLFVKKTFSSNFSDSAGPSCWSLTEDAAGEMAPSLDVSLRVDGGGPLLGQSIRLCVTITNRSSSPRALIAYVDAQMKEYNSNPQESFWKTHQAAHVQPHEVLTLRPAILYSEYEWVLSAEDIVNVAVVVKDMQTSERALAAQEISVNAPEISIQVDGGSSIHMNKGHTAHVAFTNPFISPLSGAVLSVEGSGLLQGQEVVRLAFLEPGRKMEKTVSILATTPGTKLLVATLTHGNGSKVVSRSFHKVSVTAA
ncbi:protein-glutamine gamma-glutamyltransferase 5-like [Cololabis saira]|uniref:protein-glutamine gamma-glutamyltransferase 5-like n=1 Tax=Cololabis saira TaxID=129043 RepID=UPI002AD3268C|nr:protein-glutamine gamma-glutamyltransferase 5-like [Cololabis saira]